jgi:hypothetical protein
MMTMVLVLHTTISAEPKEHIVYLPVFSACQSLFFSGSNNPIAIAIQLATLKEKVFDHARFFH